MTPEAARPDSRGRRRPRPSTLERALIASISSASWIEETDRAAVRLARDLAAVLDSSWKTLLGEAVLDVEVVGRLAHLLRELGLTPGSRYRLGLWDPVVDDSLAEILRIADAPDRDSERSVPAE